MNSWMSLALTREGGKTEMIGGTDGEMDILGAAGTDGNAGPLG
jgi:hypothetical protein